MIVITFLQRAILFLFTGFLLSLGFASFQANAGSNGELVAGWLENAFLEDHQIQIKAKLDTGADVSSLNAPLYELFEQDGGKWVRFRVQNSVGKSVVLERPVVRYATIVRAGAQKSRRPVIELLLCVGGLRKKTEVNLSDRTGLDYQLLIGRNFLSEGMLVHSGKTFLKSGLCN